MSKEKIEKAVTGAVSNIGVENMNLSKEELKIIKEALAKNSNTKSLLHKLMELIQESRYKDNNDKTKK